MRVLITVRAYPNPSRATQESSCTAGVTRDGQWVRLFPLNWRRLQRGQRFSKYDWIELSGKRSRDPRPESYVPDESSIRVVGQVGTDKGTWADRRRILVPLLDQSIEELQQKQAATGKSLGMIRPAQIRRLIIEPADREWNEEQGALLSQLGLFDQSPRTPLQKVPFKFSYEFTCQNSGCRSHRMMTVDWEIHQAYRDWSRRYGPQWEGKFRQRWEQEMIHRNDTHFYVGTMFAHQGTWIIIGNFYPKR